MTRAVRYPVRAADGVRLSLHRLPPHAEQARGPVLLVPGTFTARTLWLGPEGDGFAPMLARQGWDVWLLEPRGHGESERPRRWTMTDWIELDAPAAVEAVVREAGAQGVYWVGHSAGGVVGAAFSGTRHPAARALRGLVLLGAPGPEPTRGRRRLLARLARLGTVAAPWLPVPGRLLRLGPESEPGSLVSEWMGWNLAGAWRDPRGDDYLAALQGVCAPVLAVAGAGDPLLAPPGNVQDLLRRFGPGERTLVVAGRATGFRRDYDHAGLVIGRAAREEIWPRVAEWLARQEGKTVQRGEQ